MKVLIVDDDIDFRGLAARLLRRRFPNVEVAEYDPEVLGLPRPDFPWADFDLVLLDHELRAEHTGLDWLRRFASIPGAPAVIFASGAGSDVVAAQAIKLGAADYLSKRDIDAERLGSAVNTVLTARRAVLPTRDLQSAAMRAVEPPLARAMSRVGVQLRRLVGCGGTADVYLAERLIDRHTVVVKILRSALLDRVHARRRFEMEARMLHALESPHVVRVYRHGSEAERPYMVMEYFGHGDLSQRIVAGGLPVATARAHLRAILHGLVAIHANGIVHRDLKPANVMFRYDDSLALTDFGIAKNASQDPGFTSTDSIVGTPTYLSPEQAEGQATDARSDLYSAGVIFFELLTGERPYKGGSAPALFMQHASAPVPRLPSRLSFCQPVVDALMAKSRDERVASAGAALEILAASTPER